MKTVLFAGILAAALAASAQDTAPGESNHPAPPMVVPRQYPASRVDFAPELAAVTAQLKDKFDAGRTNAADLFGNLHAINTLIDRHFKNGNREQVARLFLLDAHIYADGVHDMARARAIWTQVIRDYPGTVAARGASLSLARAQAELAADPDPSIPEGLAVNQKFPDFNSTDLAGRPLSISAQRGHVTLINFWATTAEPSRAEMTNVLATYQQFHAQGFDVIGVSLDSDRAAVVNFLQTHGLPWPEYFDGLAWNNQLAVKYQVYSLPMNYLLDTHGVIIGRDLRANSLPEVVYKAVTTH